MPCHVANYQCDNCGEVSEIYTHDQMSKEDGTVIKDIPSCPQCGSVLLTKVLGGHATKLHDPKVYEETMKKRSADHTLKEIKKKAGWKTGVLPPNFGRTKQS
jgi:hypothetical protein